LAPDLDAALVVDFAFFDLACDARPDPFDFPVEDRDRVEFEDAERRDPGFCFVCAMLAIPFACCASGRTSYPQLEQIIKRERMRETVHPSSEGRAATLATDAGHEGAI
jgi:hypothetical protein